MVGLWPRLTSFAWRTNHILRQFSTENVVLNLNLDGRYWIRTSDPFRVKEVRYHCANRPHSRTLNHAISAAWSKQMIVIR